MGVGSGLTGGHWLSRSSIRRQSLGMWYPDGSLTVFWLLGVVVTLVVRLSGAVASGRVGRGEAKLVLWIVCSVSESLARGKCVMHVLHIPALQRRSW